MGAASLESTAQLARMLLQAVERTQSMTNCSGQDNEQEGASVVHSSVGQSITLCTYINVPQRCGYISVTEHRCFPKKGGLVNIGMAFVAADGELAQCFHNMRSTVWTLAFLADDNEYS